MIMASLLAVKSSVASRAAFRPARVQVSRPLTIRPTPIRSLVLVTRAVDQEAVFEQVKAIVVEQLGAEADKVKAESTFVDDLGADSLDTVEFMMQVEEQFGLTFDESNAEKVSTVGDVVNVIVKELEAKDK